ncbi:cysteine dioxygenase type 1-like [Oculina patagonica]
MEAKKCLEPPESIEDVAKGLHVLFEEDHVNVEQVISFLESYRSNPADWAKYANYDPHRYTRNLVDEGNGKFNLIVLCWGEGQGSSIHDHADAHCFLKVLDGRLKETQFPWPSESEPEKPLEPTATRFYETNEVNYINDTIGLHRVENVSHTDTAASLHVYIPAFDMCQSFDQRTGHKRKCQVTFWSKYGLRTPYKPSSCTN